MQQPNIVLEGPDFAGKSTLAEELALRFNDHKVYHTGGPVLNYAEYHNRVADMLHTARTGPIIFDRVPMVSGRIYGTVLENHDGNIPPSRWYDLQLFCPYIFILCHPNEINQVTLEDYLERQKGKAHKSLDYARRAFAYRYKLREDYMHIPETIRSLNSRVFIYDYLTHTPAQVERWIMTSWGKD